MIAQGPPPDAENTHMRRLGGVVLLVLLTGCGSAAEDSTGPVRVAAELPVVTTTTSAPTTSTTSSTTSTTIRVTPSTARPTTSVPSTRAPATTAPRAAAPVPAVGAGCDPNYAGACIPSGADVDCGDITAKRFRVVGRDVHRLDADGDGIACES